MSATAPPSPPRQPPMTLTPASPPSKPPPSPPLVRLAFPPSPSHSRSRSPSPARSRSPSPAPSFARHGVSSALAQAGLGLLSVPNSPATDETTVEDDWGRAPTDAPRRSSNDFVHHEQPRRASSFDVLSNDAQSHANRGRKVSFGRTEPSASTSGAPTSLSAGVPSTMSLSTLRKTSGPRALIRRAKSFGTSPVLPSAAVFGGPPGNNKRSDNSTTAPPASLPTSPRLPPSPPIPSPPLPLSSTTSLRPSASPDASTSNLPPPVPAAEPNSTPNPTAAPQWLQATDFGPPVDTSLNGKEKQQPRERSKTLEVGNGGGRRKSTMLLRRGTFSLFRRNDSNPPSEPSTPYFESPSGSPAHSPSASSTDLPSLPSLPSLQLSSAPYRMSWGFGATTASPSSSPARTSSPSTAPIPIEQPSASSPSPPVQSSPSPATRKLSSAVQFSEPVLPPASSATPQRGSPSSTSLRRNGSWTSKSSTPKAVSSSPEEDKEYAVLGLWMELNGGGGGSARSSSPRKVLTRAGRSNSDTGGRISAFDADGRRRIPRSQSGATLSTTAPVETIARPPSPLKPTSMEHGAASRSSGGLGRRPTTANSTNNERGGVLGAVTGFFGSSSSMSRSLSNNSALATAPAAGGGGETSEFGALFGASPAKNRKRGLSVGNGIFGGGSASLDARKRAGSSSSLSNTWVPPGQSNEGLLTPTALDPTPSSSTSGTRSRASTDPRRLSTSSNSSQSTFFPPGTVANGSAPLSNTHLPSPPSSPNVAPRSSFNFTTRPRAASVKVEEGETPESFVTRLVAAVSKSEVSRVLASSSDPFYASALTAYLATFDFAHDPLDIALRKFLMEASLPTETQQIDRVMEAFAIRYNSCNPGLFVSSDTPYVLAFSLVMLSTDQFNPSNKSKMSKADYVRNTKIDGVATEVLEYFFDQITLTPFVFVEDEGGPRSELAQSTSSFFSTKDKNKIDPYHLIALGQTRRLRINVEASIPTRSPFSFTGTSGFFDATALHQLFARAPILQVTSRARSKTLSTPPPDTAPIDGAPLSQTMSNMTFVAPPKAQKDAISSLKITLAGVLSRKEDLAEGGKKAASRKWKEWSVVLTGSQLLFFKDATYAEQLKQTLAVAAASQTAPDENHVLICSIQSSFKPDAVLSLASSAAIYDGTYQKHPNVFRLVAPAGRQYLFQARDLADLNSWIHAINYAASFKTSGIRMRGLNGKPRSSDTSSPPPQSPVPSVMAWGPVPSLASSTSTPGGNDTPLPEGTSHPLSPVTEEDTTLPASLRDALRASRPSGESADSGYARGSEEMKLSLSSPGMESDAFARALPSPSSRAELLRSKIFELEEQIRHSKNTLHPDLRLARNFGVLTPFRTASRERLQQALPTIEKRVAHARMHLAKLACYREVLARDLLVEDRSERTRHPSLRRRATSQHQPSSPISQPASTTRAWSPGRPRPSYAAAEDHDSAPEELHHSFTDDELDRLRSPPMMVRSTTEDPWSSSNRLRAASNASTGGPSEDELPTSRPLPSPVPSFTSLPVHGSSDVYSVGPSTSSSSFAPIDEHSAQQEGAKCDGEAGGDEQEEVAEDWADTKAAKWVSMVDYKSMDRIDAPALAKIREERKGEKALESSSLKDTL